MVPLCPSQGLLLLNGYGRRLLNWTVLPRSLPHPRPSDSMSFGPKKLGEIVITHFLCVFISPACMGQNVSSEEEVAPCFKQFKQLFTPSFIVCQAFVHVQCCFPSSCRRCLPMRKPRLRATSLPWACPGRSAPWQTWAFLSFLTHYICTPPRQGRADAPFYR